MISKEAVRTHCKEIFAVELMKTFEGWGSKPTKWKAVYAKLYNVRKMSLFTKDELLQRVHVVAKAKALRRWEILRDAGHFVRRMEQKRLAKVNTFECFCKYDGVAKAIQKIFA